MDGIPRVNGVLWQCNFMKSICIIDQPTMQIALNSCLESLTLLSRCLAVSLKKQRPPLPLALRQNE
jgi:hypothetical protein